MLSFREEQESRDRSYEMRTMIGKSRTPVRFRRRGQLATGHPAYRCERRRATPAGLSTHPRRPPPSRSTARTFSINDDANAVVRTGDRSYTDPAQLTWRLPMSAEPVGESTGEIRPLRISPELARELLRVLREEDF